jgi:predicted nuclease with TOPRIM domain
MNGTSPSSDSSLSYTETTSIDKTALAKAEAKYEHDLEEINKKDKKFDLSLSKLESERTALTTEYDSVKKVIQDNIERTFGIFS